MKACGSQTFKKCHNSFTKLSLDARLDGVLVGGGCLELSYATHER